MRGQLISGGGARDTAAYDDEIVTVHFGSVVRSFIAPACGRDQAGCGARRGGANDPATRRAALQNLKGRSAMARTALAFSVMPDSPLEKIVEWPRDAEEMGYAAVFMTEANNDSVACWMALGVQTDRI